MRSKIIVLIAAFTCTPAFAQVDIEQLKEIALQSCNAQTAALPEADQEAALEICKCTVENTDFELTMKVATDPSVIEEVQAKALEVGEKCATGEL